MENVLTEGRKSTMKLIRPHGGTLINRQVTGAERERLIESAAHMPALRLGAREISDLEMIATGAYSPLEGFLDRSDYNAVCSSMRLANGVAWSISQTSFVTTKQSKPNSYTARRTRHTLASAIFPIRVTGCWEERLAWSTVRFIAPTNTFKSARWKSPMDFSCIRW